MCFFFKYGCSNLDSFLTLEEKSRTLDWGEVLTLTFSPYVQCLPFSNSENQDVQNIFMKLLRESSSRIK